MQQIKNKILKENKSLFKSIAKLTHHEMHEGFYYVYYDGTLGEKMKAKFKINSAYKLIFVSEVKLG